MILSAVLSSLWCFIFQTMVTPNSLARFATLGILTVTMGDTKIELRRYQVTHFLARQTSIRETRDDGKYCLKIRQES